MPGFSESGPVAARTTSPSGVSHRRTDLRTDLRTGCRRFQKTIDLGLRRQQSLDALPQLRVVAAGLVEVLRSLLGVASISAA